MPTNLKRMTITITPEMEPLLNGMKKEIFYNCSQSEMIRTLIEAGLSNYKPELIPKQNKDQPQRKTG